jgi:hypothetical protein
MGEYTSQHLLANKLLLGEAALFALVIPSIFSIFRLILPSQNGRATLP